MRSCISQLTPSSDLKYKLCYLKSCYIPSSLQLIYLKRAIQVVNYDYERYYFLIKLIAYK